jgi:hypothetical protein
MDRHPLDEQPGPTRTFDRGCGRIESINWCFRHAIETGLSEALQCARGCGFQEHQVGQ